MVSKLVSKLTTRPPSMLNVLQHLNQPLILMENFRNSTVLAENLRTGLMVKFRLSGRGLIFCAESISWEVGGGPVIDYLDLDKAPI